MTNHSSPVSADRMARGRALYLAVYESQGGQWEANDCKELWCDKADRYLELAGNAPAQCAPVAERLMDAEIALNTWDTGRNSEYWLRHPTPFSSTDRAQTADEAAEAMADCPYWNGEKSLTRPTPRIEVICPDPRTSVYDALVDGHRIGSYSNALDAEMAAKAYVKSYGGTGMSRATTRIAHQSVEGAVKSVLPPAVPRPSGDGK